MIPYLPLIQLSLLILSLPTSHATPTSLLSAIPLYPLSLPLLDRQNGVRNRADCEELCRTHHGFLRCLDLCAELFPDQWSPSTTTVIPNRSASKTTKRKKSRRGALTPTCGLSFPRHTGVCLTSQEWKLARLINDYRASLGLHRVPISKTLSTVAQCHAFDSQKNNPTSKSCNLHSWSGACATWSAVCYTSNHAQASRMWSKPSEISPQFTGYGYEISAFYSAGETAEMALDQWRRSSGHRAVIVEQGSWGPFRSMGVGIYEDYAHVWFAHEEDPAGRMTPC